MLEATLLPSTFREIYEYYKGKKLPEKGFFENTVVREFEVPREHALRCVEIFNANMEKVELVRVASNGRWLSTELNSSPAADERLDGGGTGETKETNPGGKGDGTPPLMPPVATARLPRAARDLERIKRRVFVAWKEPRVVRAD